MCSGSSERAFIVLAFKGVESRPYHWHAPSSRHLRALLSVVGGVRLGVWGLVLVVCMCVTVSGVLFTVGVCVCDLLICLHLHHRGYGVEMRGALVTTEVCMLLFGRFLNRGSSERAVMFVAFNVVESRSPMLNNRSEEDTTAFYSYLLCFMNTATLNMYVFLSYTGSPGLLHGNT